MDEKDLRIDQLEKRFSQEHQKLRNELGQLRGEHKELLKDHRLLAEDFLTTRRKLHELLIAHREDVKQMAVLVGNSASKLFPNLDAAFREIDEALGLVPKQENPPRKKPMD